MHNKSLLLRRSFLFWMVFTLLAMVFVSPSNYQHNLASIPEKTDPLQPSMNNQTPTQIIPTSMAAPTNHHLYFGSYQTLITYFEGTNCSGNITNPFCFQNMQFVEDYLNISTYDGGSLNQTYYLDIKNCSFISSDLINRNYPSTENYRLYSHIVNCTFQDAYVRLDNDNLFDYNTGSMHFYVGSNNTIEYNTIEFNPLIPQSYSPLLDEYICIRIYGNGGNIIRYNAIISNNTVIKTGGITPSYIYLNRFNVTTTRSYQTVSDVGNHYISQCPIVFDAAMVIYWDNGSRGNWWADYYLQNPFASIQTLKNKQSYYSIPYITHETPILRCSIDRYPLVLEEFSLQSPIIVEMNQTIKSTTFGLNWSTSPSAQCYKIFLNDSYWLTVSNTSYTFALEDKTIYHFRVSAYNGWGESVQSGETVITVNTEKDFSMVLDPILLGVGGLGIAIGAIIGLVIGRMSKKSTGGGP